MNQAVQDTSLMVYIVDNSENRLADLIDVFSPELDAGIIWTNKEFSINIESTKIKVHVTEKLRNILQKTANYSWSKYLRIFLNVSALYEYFSWLQLS